MTDAMEIEQAQPGELRVAYGTSDHDGPDLLYCFGGEGASSSDASMLSDFFEHLQDSEGMTLREQLKRRGYNIKTLTLTVRKEL